MKKLISVLLILMLILISGCGKKENEEQPDVNAPVNNTEQQADTKKEEPSTNEADPNNFLKMIEEFNSLDEGDPKKEELREKLEEIFDKAVEAAPSAQ